MNHTQKTALTIGLGLICVVVLFFVADGLVSMHSARTALAAPIEYVPLAPLPGVGDAGTGKISSLPKYLVAMFKLLIGIAAALAVIKITIGGIQYMSTDSMFGKSEGKQSIEQALLGLLLAIGAWLILNTVNPATLRFNFNPDPIPGSVSTQLRCEVGEVVVILDDGDRICVPEDAPPPPPPTEYYKVLVCTPVATYPPSDMTPRVNTLAIYNTTNYNNSMAEAMAACQSSPPLPGERIFSSSCSLAVVECRATRP